MDHIYKFALAMAALVIGVFVVGFQEDTIAQAETAAKHHSVLYMEAFNDHDAEKLASLWAEDALYVNLSTHDVLQGRDEITEYFKQQFSDQKDENLKISIDRIKIEDNKITEQGKAIVSTTGEPEKQSIFHAELVNIDGIWLLQKVDEVDVMVPSSHYEQLKEIEWLVGNWRGRNDEYDLSLSIEWEDNKNFLKQEFTIQILNHKDLWGEQIIGWDPNAKAIRSWVFDSDGGFGKGTWTNEGTNWYLSMVFILPDGRKSSATYIYTKESDKSFSLSAVDRDVDGKLLPNTKPFKLEKSE